MECVYIGISGTEDFAKNRADFQSVLYWDCGVPAYLVEDDEEWGCPGRRISNN